MERIKQRRYRAETWRGILGRFAESGLTAPAFCARERISLRALRSWRSRLEGEPDQALIAKAAELTRKHAGFIDLGALRPSDPRFEVRLELGGGVVLSLARG